MSHLFSLLRDGLREIVVDGQIMVATPESSVFHTGEAVLDYPMRSLLKPFQFIAAEVPLERWRDEGASLRYTACLGSISSTKDQTERMKAWYAEPSLKALLPFLKVPLSFPMDDANRVHMKERGEGPGQLTHFCFSKHMGILEGCAAHGLPLEGYLSPSHPYHRKLQQLLAQELGEPIECPWAVDGCGLPTPVFGLDRVARLYASLASSPRLSTVRDRMLSHPEWIVGPGRLDTALMQANPGKLVAKEGADGLVGIAVLPTPRFPNGLGIVVKILAGYYTPLASLALAPLLEELELKSVHRVPKGQEIAHHYRPFERTPRRVHDISPPLTERVAVWPGDHAFRRVVGATLDHNNYAISSLETTVHVGAHTDAPNHFQAGGCGIDAVPLWKYSGPCQVMEVRKTPGQVILPSDLGEIKAARVLLKTSSFPDPNRFNTDFVALSDAAVREMAARGVVLVGIDTPSIDSFDSKPLPAHHATAQASMAILEGIDLSNVGPGIYELSALPLRIADGDASPVRAVLFES